jgi:GNAT superfamily N-acetyltransferase
VSSPVAPGSRAESESRVHGAVTVRPVRGRRDLMQFIKLPWRLYADSPLWVPPLISERRRHLHRKRNPFFEHAEAEYFLAERDGETVGRITAHYDRRFNEFHHNDWGMFGFFESTNDPEVVGALLATAEDWLRRHGRDRMVGPMDFSTNHECGVLVDGFDLPPQILENWHHPYYRALLEGHGLTKAMDLYKWSIDPRRDRSEVMPVIYELAGKLEGEHGITVRNMRRRDFRNEVRRFMEVYNEAWEDNWGFVPLTDAELEDYAKQLKPLLDEDWAYVAEKDGRTVGVALTLPDYNQVLAKLNGRLFPIGWLRFLLGRRKIDAIRVFALGVRPEERHTGTAAGFYARTWDTAIAQNLRWAETGWILETNEPMNRAMEALAGHIAKTYRVYEKALAPAPAGA